MARISGHWVAFAANGRGDLLVFLPHEDNPGVLALSLGSRDREVYLHHSLTMEVDWQGKTFQNVEYMRVRDGKVQAIECYFGAQSSFASAVGRQK
jgi:hypothetical protein